MIKKNFIQAFCSLALLAVTMITACTLEDNIDILRQRAVEKAKVTVTFEANGGTAVEAQRVSKNGMVTLPTHPTKFDTDGTTPLPFGWWFKENPSAVPVPVTLTPWDFQNDKITKNTTLYASWNTVDEYTVVFFSNGGKFSDDTTFKLIDNAVTTNTANSLFSSLSIPDPTRAGYVFDGWNTKADGTGTETDPEVVDASIAVYAKWEVQTFTVTFDTNGGDAWVFPETGTRTVTPPATVGAANMPTATRTSYVFVEWNTMADGTGTSFTGTTPVTANITIYAQWVVAYTVVTDTTDNTADTATLTFTFPIDIDALSLALDISDIKVAEGAGKITIDTTGFNSFTPGFVYVVDVTNVERAGIITVWIDLPGIDPTHKEVTVHKYSPSLSTDATLSSVEVASVSATTLGTPASTWDNISLVPGSVTLSSSDVASPASIAITGTDSASNQEWCVTADIDTDPSSDWDTDDPITIAHGEILWIKSIAQDGTTTLIYAIIIDVPEVTIAASIGTLNSTTNWSDFTIVNNAIKAAQGASVTLTTALIDDFTAAITAKIVDNGIKDWVTTGLASYPQDVDVDGDGTGKTHLYYIYSECGSNLFDNMPPDWSVADDSLPSNPQDTDYPYNTTTITYAIGSNGDDVTFVVWLVPVAQFNVEFFGGSCTFTIDDQGPGSNSSPSTFTTDGYCIGMLGTTKIAITSGSATLKVWEGDPSDLNEVILDIFDQFNAESKIYTVTIE